MLRMCRISILLIIVSLLFSCVALSKVENYEEHALSMAGAEEIHMAATESIDGVNGLFPDKVYIKTATQTFNKDYQFCLSDGKIFYKGRNPGKGPEDWELLETGLPYSKIARFKTPKRIIALAGDVDSILAMDEDGKVYEYYFERTTIRRHITWYHVMGFPTKGQLALNRTTGNTRAWTVGTRRSEVLWYEDIFGNQHHYGSMGIETYYMMNEAGDTIRFTDSGLPADLSRSMPVGWSPAGISTTPPPAALAASMAACHFAVSSLCPSVDATATDSTAMMAATATPNSFIGLFMSLLH